MVQSPYQQNIDIVKGFFRRPIVLVVAILSFSSLLSELICYVFLSNSLTTGFRELLFNSQGYNSSLSSDSVNTSHMFSLDVTGILLAVSFLLFFILSHKHDNNLAVPSVMFKVISIISLVFVCILTFVGILLVIILGSLGNFLGTSDPTLREIEIFIYFFIAIFVFLIAFALTTSISNVVFANSIRKSLTSIYLKNKGAMLFGVMCFISAGLSIAGSIFAYIILKEYFSLYFNNAQLTLIGISTAISIAASIALGILAVKYSAYIKDLSVRFQIEAPAYPQETDIFEEPQSYRQIPQMPVQQYAEPTPAPYNTQPDVPPAPQAPVQSYSEPPQAPYSPQADAVSAAPLQEEVSAPVQEETFEQYEEPIQAPISVPVEDNTDEEQEDYTSSPKAPKFCTQCGYPVGKYNYFCQNCGSPIRTIKD
ncbi:MAG: hypothetical protein J1E41_08030 [Ruminococcus sp.]|nr:hypothetical protein [Ruminococcus sp.]